MDWFSSDWHLGHDAVRRLANRPFGSVSEMNVAIMHNMLEEVKKGDSFYFLGDIAWRDELAIQAVRAFAEKGVDFHWILGNHDEKYKLQYFQPYCKSISTRRVITRNDIRINMCHFPQLVWNNSFRNSFHLFGHIHAGSFELEEISNRMEGKCLNVNLEFHNYKPWSLDEVFDYMESRNDNWDYKLLKEGR